MDKQLRIHFPLFSPETFGRVKEQFAKQEEETKDAIIEHLKHVIAGFKGARTKRKKKNGN